MKNKIDIVVPYVNGLDTEWQKIHSQYRDNIDYTRFDGNDILKYVFRSIDKNVSWINTVHLLVMQESQIPEWINRDCMHIVYHKDFIPQEHLPVFNSSAIEMYLWNIPELSENFIYINDDIIFNNPIKPYDHFDENMNPLVTMTNVTYRDAKLNTDYAQTFIGACKLASKNTKYNCWNENNNTLLRPGHGPQAFSRSLIKQIYNEFKNEIEASISKFREPYNYNQYLFSSYAVFHNIQRTKPITYKYVRLFSKNLSLLYKYLTNKHIKELCINDVEQTKIEDKKTLIRLLEVIKFQNKCKYEI